MPRYGVLVDAGYLKRQLDRQDVPATPEAFCAFLERLVQLPDLAGNELYRIYIYDAAPLTGVKRKPLHGGEINFANTPVVQHNNAVHDALRKHPFVALRLGELKFRGWRLKSFTLRTDAEQQTIDADDLHADIQQKGVDMRVGLDMAALALKNIVDIIVLVASDTDFIPAMKFVRREGLQLFCISVGRAPPPGLIEHSDRHISMTR